MIAWLAGFWILMTPVYAVLDRVLPLRPKTTSPDYRTVGLLGTYDRRSDRDKPGAGKG